MSAPPLSRIRLLFHYCRLQLPAIRLPQERFDHHLERAFSLFAGKNAAGLDWADYLDKLYSLDWYLCTGCLERDNKAWESLFAMRTGRSDCLLIDALRARAVRLYPRDDERQENAVSEFWSHLLVAPNSGAPAVLARYDGQRPLVPWLIRVFQNWHVSHLRSQGGVQSLPDEEVALPLPDKPHGEQRWHDEFCVAAREWLDELGDEELLLLGLRWRFRLSQRDIAAKFGVHEGTISRQTDKLRDGCIEHVTKHLIREGWTGDDIEGFILTEMNALLLDEPKLSADQLTALLAKRPEKKPKKKKPIDDEDDDD